MKSRKIVIFNAKITFWVFLTSVPEALVSMTLFKKPKQTGLRSIVMVIVLGMNYIYGCMLMKLKLVVLGGMNFLML
jgi:hypothetical protein